MLRIAKTHNMCWCVCDNDALSETPRHPNFLLKRAIEVDVLVHAHHLKYTPSVTNRCRSLIPLATTYIC